MYVASVKGCLEAYLFFDGVHALVRSIRWILVGFHCRRRRGTWNTYGLLIRIGHTDCQSVWSYGLLIRMISIVIIRIADPYSHLDWQSVWVIRIFLFIYYIIIVNLIVNLIINNLVNFFNSFSNITLLKMNILMINN